MSSSCAVCIRTNVSIIRMAAPPGFATGDRFASQRRFVNDRRYRRDAPVDRDDLAGLHHEPVANDRHRKPGDDGNGRECKTEVGDVRAPKRVGGNPHDQPATATETETSVSRRTRSNTIAQSPAHASIEQMSPKTGVRRLRDIKGAIGAPQSGTEAANSDDVADVDGPHAAHDIVATLG
jgi:hypothetical protein